MTAVPPLCAGDLAELDSESRMLVTAGNDMVEQGRMTREELLELPSYKLGAGIQRLLAERKRVEAKRGARWWMGFYVGTGVIALSLLSASGPIAKNDVAEVAIISAVFMPVAKPLADWAIERLWHL